MDCNGDRDLSHLICANVFFVYRSAISLSRDAISFSALAIRASQSPRPSAVEVGHHFIKQDERAECLPELEEGPLAPHLSAGVEQGDCDNEKPAEDPCRIKPDCSFHE